MMDDGQVFAPFESGRTERPGSGVSVEGDLHARPASAQDAAAITVIYNQAIADRLATFEAEPRSPGQILPWINGDLPVVVACRPSGEVVGFAAALASTDRGAQAGVGELATHARRDWRSHDAGDVALGALIEAARDAGLWKLLAHVLPDNVTARALARRHGFKEVGVLEKHGRVDGVWRDCLIVERLLPENLA
jgi:phosphinothricin acetyltransferase